MITTLDHVLPEPAEPKRLIDFETARTTIGKIIAEVGFEYVYEKTDDGLNGVVCAYFTAEGKPSCIVGHLMDALDPQTADMVRTDAHANIVGLSSLVPTVLNLTNKAFDYLECLQMKQDSGMPWGQADELAQQRTAGFFSDSDQ